MNITSTHFILLLSVFITLTGCASSTKPADDSQKLDAEQQALVARVDSLEKNMAQWQQMKPSVARLVVIESDLKELIVQLGAMVEEPELAPESASESMPKPALDSKPVSKPEPEPEIKTALAPTAEIAPAVEKSVSPAVQDMPVLVLAPVLAPVVRQPTLTSPKVQLTASAYPSGPEQPIEVSNTSTNGFLADGQPDAKYALQLSSITNPWAIEPLWLELQKKYPSALEGVTPTYERVSVKGVTYFRIKVGQFSKRKLAKQACTRLKNIGGACVVSLNNGVSYQALELKDL